jgi:cytochrome c553
MKRKYCLHIAISIFVAGFYISGAQAAGDAEAGKQKSEPCAACHGVDGVSVNPAWPKLAGQGEKYLIGQLKLFKENVRINPLMNPQAANLSDQDMADLAAYYSSQTASIDSADPEKKFQGEKLLTIGERIYRGGNSASGVPACMSCHSPNGTGNDPAKFPHLAGQHAIYTAAQLRAYRSGARYQPEDHLNMMKEISTYLSDTEIDAVAEYIAGLH